MHHQSTKTRRRKYGRNSTDEQRQEATIESQMHAVDDWDRAHGGHPQPGDWEVDEGWSGFRIERPGLQRILDEARDPARDWDELLIYDKSRLSREPMHRLYILEPAFKAAGVRLLYAASPIYPDTATGRAMEWHHAGFDKWFAEQARENMDRGLRDHLRQGQCWWCPYGYRIERVPLAGGRQYLYQQVIVPEEARVVQEVVRRIGAGESATSLAYELNARQVPTARGGLWRHKTLADMCRDPYYRGSAGFGKREHVQPRRRRRGSDGPLRRERTSMRDRPSEEWWSTAAVPAILTQEEQERACAQLARNRRVKAAHPTHVYLLRGLLRCKLPRLDDPTRTCNCTLTGRAPAAARKAQPFYACNGEYPDARPGERRTCPGRAFVAETDALVWEALVDALADEAELRAAFALLQERPARERETWEGALAALGRERERLEDEVRAAQGLLREGVYGPAEYRIATEGLLPRLDQIEEQIAQAQRSLAAVRAPAADWAQIERMIGGVRAQAAGASPEKRAAVLGALLEGVDVYADRLVLRGVLGEIGVERAAPAVHQLATARPCNSELVSFEVVVARRRQVVEDGESAGQTRHALVLRRRGEGGQVA